MLTYKAVEDETSFSGEVEVDESCFGGKRKGKKGKEEVKSLLDSCHDSS